MSAPNHTAKLRPLRHLLPYFLRYRYSAIGALISLLFAAGATLALPLAMGRAIDAGVAVQSEQLSKADLSGYFLSFLAIAVALAAATAARYYFITRLGERVIADLRREVYGHVVRLHPGFFETTRSGEVISRLSADTTLIQSIVGYGASVALRNLLLLVGGFIMLAVTSPTLTGVIVLLIPAVVLPVVLLGRRVRRLSRHSQDTLAEASALAVETLNAIPTVQAFTREAFEATRFETAVEATYRAAMERTQVRALLIGLAIFTVIGAILLVLWLGTQSVLADALTAGELGQFVFYAILVAGATGALSEVWGDLQRAAGATERLVELLRTRSQIHEAVQPHPLALPVRGSLRFEGVDFSYPSRPQQQALADFSLAIEPGETVALVGPSGAGKSTVFQLLLRFYSPQRGQISIDGVDIAKLELATLRRQIALVPQDPVIFSASARDNIRYDRPDSPHEAVVRAAQAAAAAEFIERHPEGYDAPLGERGMRLSGGQRQRIAIARALLKDAPLLLLDEATSALDAESEQLVQNALESLMQGRTTLVIAHRLATVQRADRIVVMDQGRIVAQGTHQQLLAEAGLYRRLAQLQFRLETPTAPRPVDDPISP